jgi:hypothetical protein
LWTEADRVITSLDAVAEVCSDSSHRFLELRSKSKVDANLHVVLRKDRDRRCLRAGFEHHTRAHWPFPGIAAKGVFSSESDLRSRLRLDDEVLDRRCRST